MPEHTRPEPDGFSAIKQHLINPAEDAFLRAVPTLRTIAAETSAARAAIAAAATLDDSDLPGRSRANRLRVLLSRLDLTKADESNLVEHSADLSAPLKNAIADFVGPAGRRRLVAPAASSPAYASTAPTDVPTESSDSPDTEQAVDATVLILSHPNKQSSNKTLLRSRRLASLVLSSLPAFESALDQQSDICGIVVDQSFLGDLDTAEQDSLFRLGARYSTFVWWRIQAGPSLLVDVPMVKDVFARLWCANPGGQLTFQSDSRLHDWELTEATKSLRLLAENEETTVLPGELSPASLKLIVAASRQFIEANNMGSGSVELTSIRASRLTGGFSSSQVFVLRMDDARLPLVAKLDSQERILGELDRFRHFIEESDDRLRPRAYFHHGKALILFGLLGEDQDRQNAAPMLADEMECLWIRQLFPESTSPRLDGDRDRLIQAIVSAVASIGRLNRRPYRASDDGEFPTVDPDRFDRMDAVGVTWGLPSQCTEARDYAQSIYGRYREAAIVHGDMHLRNILLRGNVAHLIDYAACGGGHPAIDLVRLEMALFTQYAKPVDYAEVYQEYQRALTVERFDAERMIDNFPEFHRCVVNEVTTRGCVSARDQVLDVLRDYGGDTTDYVATKYLVAWQCLSLRDSDTLMAQATVLALSEEILSWAPC